MAKKAKNTRLNHHLKCKVHAGKRKSVNGLKKKDILRRPKSSAAVKKDHRPMCISKKKHDVGKAQAKKRKSWIAACQKAKKELGLTGFVLIKKGTRVYALAKRLHKAAQTSRRRTPPRTRAASRGMAMRTRARTRR